FLDLLSGEFVHQRQGEFANAPPVKWRIREVRPEALGAADAVIVRENGREARTSQAQVESAAPGEEAHTSKHGCCPPKPRPVCDPKRARKREAPRVFGP